MPNRLEVNTIVRELGDTESEPSIEAWAAAMLKVVLRAVPGISASFNEINLPAGRVTGWIEPPFTDEQVALMPVYRAHQTDNPLLRDHLETGSLRAKRWCDVDPAGDIRRTLLYQDFYAPIGVHDQVGVALATPPGVLVAVVVNGTESAFSKHDRDLLDALQPFLAAGYRAARQRSIGDRFEQLALADGWGVIVVDDQGVVERADGFRNGPGDPFVEPGELLPQPLLRWFEGLSPRAPGSTHGLPTELAELEITPGAHLEVRAVFGAVAPHVVLARVPPETHPILTLTVMGLTPREAQVAVALATGATNRQIAHELGIAEGTVRKHLQRVYECLGVENRAAATLSVVMATLST